MGEIVTAFAYRVHFGLKHSELPESPEDVKMQRFIPERKSPH